MSKIFGENLKEIRKSAGLRQWELSIRMNVTAQTISSWEVGRTEPTMGQMEELCKILGCEMTELLKNTYKPITLKDRQLIDAFNDAPETVQSAIRTLLGLDGTVAKSATDGTKKYEQKSIKWYEDTRR